ncbi:MAG: flagellar hook assembly protein FlgD [Humidesulfovibrio sp.]|jgi:flagellar basal-body rod modification protein FlgD|nr:flagellar hook assembly protein FlgD [Humidesulfovibrio sp.]PKN08521.1 MAG: flagellar hook capping protein [Deltaproteobacteria bacterium HGW-Deltaproteobacteria-8]
MSVVANSNILGQYEAAQTTSTTHKTSLDQDAFLTLLVAQLEHQDPLNPMDDKDMTAQLAQFSSLAELTKINTGITSLVDAQGQDTVLSAVAFIGKGIKADGYSLSKSGDATSTVYYSLGESVSDMQVNIYATDGTLVRTDVIGAKQAGEYQYTWDGKDADGNAMADGTYGVAIVAADTSGAAVLVQSKISGVVTGVVTQNGATMLELADGRTVALSSVSEVVQPAASTSDTTSS